MQSKKNPVNHVCLTTMSDIIESNYFYAFLVIVLLVHSPLPESTSDDCVLQTHPSHVGPHNPLLHSAVSVSRIFYAYTASKPPLNKVIFHASIIILLCLFVSPCTQYLSSSTPSPNPLAHTPVVLQNTHTHTFTHMHTYVHTDISMVFWGWRVFTHS